MNISATPPAMPDEASFDLEAPCQIICKTPRKSKGYTFLE